MVALLLAFFLLLFLVAEALRLPLLTDPSAALGGSRVVAAVVGTGLLLADVVLPVPASVVMIANGAVFGVAVGAALSFVGGLGATLLAFWVGHRSRGFLPHAIAPEQERRANDLLARYGPLVIVVTRPLPMVAETVAILAGRSDVSWRTAALAGAAGGLVPAVLYALAGAVAATVSGTVVVGGVIAVAALFWLGGRAVGRLGPGRGPGAPDDGEAAAGVGARSDLEPDPE